LLLERAAQLIARSYGCSRFAVVWGEEAQVKELQSPALYGVLAPKINLLPDWTVAFLPLGFSKADYCQICLGTRNGGRRFLSEDLSALQGLRAALISLVERLRREELERLAQEAELNALQAQINPHFLFNALNTLYGTIGRDSPEARKLVLNLADVCRYRLQSSQKYVTLSEEIEIVRAYLEVEALRMGDRLTAKINVDEQLNGISIPILTIQPLIENAVKHGASAAGFVAVQLTIAASDTARARIMVQDDGPGFHATPLLPGNGIALKNIHRRLHLCYHGKSGLQFQSGEDGTKVWFNIPYRLAEFART
jgi:LytS/YehU family sensor histidine kinase